MKLRIAQKTRVGKPVLIDDGPGSVGRCQAICEFVRERVPKCKKTGGYKMRLDVLEKTFYEFYERPLWGKRLSERDVMVKLGDRSFEGYWKITAEKDSFVIVVPERAASPLPSSVETALQSSEIATKDDVECVPSGISEADSGLSSAVNTEPTPPLDDSFTLPPQSKDSHEVKVEALDIPNVPGGEYSREALLDVRQDNQVPFLEYDYPFTINKNALDYKRSANRAESAPRVVASPPLSNGNESDDGWNIPVTHESSPNLISVPKKTCEPEVQLSKQMQKDESQVASYIEAKHNICARNEVHEPNVLQKSADKTPSAEAKQAIVKSECSPTVEDVLTSDLGVFLTSLLSPVPRLFADLLPSERALVDHSGNVLEVLTEKPGEEFVHVRENIVPADVKFMFGLIRNIVEMDLLWMLDTVSWVDFSADQILACSIVRFIPPRCLLMKYASDDAMSLMLEMSNAFSSLPEPLKRLEPCDLVPGMECICTVSLEANNIQFHYARVILLGYNDSTKKISAILVDCNHSYNIDVEISQLWEMPREFSLKTNASNVFLGRIRSVDGIFLNEQKDVGEFVSRLAGQKFCCALFGRDPRKMVARVVDFVNDAGGERETWFSELLDASHFCDDPSLPGTSEALQYCVKYQSYSNNAYCVDNGSEQKLGEGDQKNVGRQVVENSSVDANLPFTSEKKEEIVLVPGRTFDYVEVLRTLTEDMIISKNTRGYFHLMECIRDQLEIAKKRGEDVLVETCSETMKELGVFATTTFCIDLTDVI